MSPLVRVSGEKIMDKIGLMGFKKKTIMLEPNVIYKILPYPSKSNQTPKKIKEELVEPDEVIEEKKPDPKPIEEFVEEVIYEEVVDCGEVIDGALVEDEVVEGGVYEEIIDGTVNEEESELYDEGMEEEMMDEEIVYEEHEEEGIIEETLDIIEETTIEETNSNDASDNQISYSHPPKPKRKRFSHKDHECPECKRSFEFYSQLKNHKNKCKIAVPINKFQCACGLIYRSLLRYREHLDETGRTCKTCPVCKKSYSMMHNIKKHYRAHPSHRPVVVQEPVPAKVPKNRKEVVEQVLDKALQSIGATEIVEQVVEGEELVEEIIEGEEIVEETIEGEEMIEYIIKEEIVEDESYRDESQIGEETDQQIEETYEEQEEIEEEVVETTHDEMVYTRSLPYIKRKRFPHKEHICPDCNRNFEFYSQLKAHKPYCHKIPFGESPNFTCACGLSYRSLLRYREHLDETGRSCRTCPVCNKSYSMMHNIKKHYRSNPTHNPALKKHWEDKKENMSPGDS